MKEKLKYQAFKAFLFGGYSTLISIPVWGWMQFWIDRTGEFMIAAMVSMAILFVGGFLFFHFSED